MILLDIFFGINPNIKIVKTVKIVIACPDGKLLLQPGSIFPITVKLEGLNADAGLGTEKIRLRVMEKIAENIDADSNDSHNSGISIYKTDSSERPTNASPIWVRLY